MRVLLPLVLLAIGMALFFFVSRDLAAVEIIAGLGAAWLSWPAAVFGALRAAGATSRDLTLGVTLVWAALFPALMLVSESLVLLLSAGKPWWLAPLLSGALALATFGMAAKLWLTPLRPIFALRSALGDPSKSEEAARNLVASFESAPRPASPIRRRRAANRAIAAVGVLAEARRWIEAERVLDTVPLDGLDRLRRSALQASRATVCLYAGKRNQAWSALKDGYANADDPSLRRALTLTDVLLSALDGHGQEALDRLREIPEPTAPRLRRAWLIARCHAFAVAGLRDDAIASLLELRAHSKDGLERILDLGGPAAELAAEMLDEPARQAPVA